MAARKAKKIPRPTPKKGVARRATKATTKAASRAAPVETDAEPADEVVAAAPAPRENKTQFIMLQPLEMPAKQVVAKAAEAGISLTEKAVYNARTTAKKKRATVAAAKKAARRTAKEASTTTASTDAPSSAPVAKKKGRPVGSGATNNSAFIREQPTSMKAADVVAAGAAAGLSFTPGLVYSVRTAAKKAGQVAAPVVAPATRRGRPPKAAGATPPAVIAAGSREKQLVTLAVDIGLARAVELIEGLRSRIDELL